MKKVLLVLMGMLWFNANSQTLENTTAEARNLYSAAKTYLQKGDYANAIMVFNQTVNVDPENLLFRRELAYAYYLQGDLMKAEYIVMPLTKREDADVETYMLACKILASKKKTSDAEDIINKGIKKFPKSGMLYCEKGELFTLEKKYKSASKVWEEGIEMDPSYHLNYYKLAKVYSFTKNYLWAILYGETFVNMESFSSKTYEVHKIIFESYKFLMAELNNQALDGKINRYENPKNFEQSCLKIFDGLRNVVTGGIQVDNLTMLRARFLMEWNSNYAMQYPNELFDYQQRLLLNGYYDCYNQWLFGKLDNEKAFKVWTQKYAATMNKFDTYFRSEKLEPREKQYYQLN